MATTYRYKREATQVVTFKCAGCGVRLPPEKAYNLTVSACSEDCLKSAFAQMFRCGIKSGAFHYGHELGVLRATLKHPVPSS